MIMNITVIGSGFGGLAIAIRMQAQGHQVTLLEKNQHVGGHAYPLHKKGYSFDMGPSLITAPEIIERIFAKAGKKLDDYVEMTRLDPFYRIYFHDHTFIDYVDDSERMKEQMMRTNPKDAENYDRFMQASKGIYEAVIKDGLGSTPFMDIKTNLSFVPRALKLNALLPVFSFVKRYFKDPRHQFTFSFHPLFIGGNPFRAPSVYLMIPYLEKTGGVWFTKGGMYSLVRAFETLFKELGGTVHTQTPAKEIIVTNGKATAVRTERETLPSDIVISNADIVHTYKDLIPSVHRKKWSDKKLDSLDIGMSAFLIYLGVKKQYPKLKHHTLILSHRYKELVTDIFDKKILPDDFSMYLHAPTRTDPDMAPPGCESMYVLIPVANLQSGIDWDEKAQPFAQVILNYLQNDFGLEDLQKNIEVMEIFTPKDFLHKANSTYGSAWGVEPKLTQTAYFRPHNRSEDISNLYFVGAGTHPGAGLPGVMLTAETTENVIHQDLRG
jgi:phytoene desaturase